MDTRLQAPIFRDAAGTRITKDRAIDSQILTCQHPLMETPASSFKLRANAPKGQKRFPISCIGGPAVSPRAGLSQFGHLARQRRQITSINL